jgi:DNA (cytosine-5)-methyltransferase 1
VELFAGVGGFSLGMKAAGIDVALAVEKDEQTQATYSENFPSTSVLCADVQELTGLEIRRLLEVAQNQQGREWDGKIALVFGGPPCQGLSRIGKRDVDDPRNQLIAHFCRLVEELQPTAFVLENVPDLLLPKYAGLIEPSLQQLQQAGYNTWTWVLNAKDYGVPQKSKTGLYRRNSHHTSPRLPAAASQVVTVREAIADLTKLSEEAFPQLFDTDELQLDLKQPLWKLSLLSTYSSSNRYSLHHPQLILTYLQAVASPVTLHQLLNDSRLPHRERRSQKAVCTALSGTELPEL